ncbi:hypothetical protein [uncultured Negativibacillus sp.]|uniref:hypothetical protein n=1 Tax=uncultured Negativibacillus sp. TaxID=1980696 RepID=UPI0025CB7993|nr:hypothetical protein [uncultured Negativibacillus sp.]
MEIFKQIPFSVYDKNTLLPIDKNKKLMVLCKTYKNKEVSPQNNRGNEETERNGTVLFAEILLQWKKGKRGWKDDTGRSDVF